MFVKLAVLVLLGVVLSNCNPIEDQVNTTGNSTERVDSSGRTKDETTVLLKRIAMALAITAAVAWPLAFIWWCGFRRAGVAGGSSAAGYQSIKGDVKSGSCFAVCQCVGTSLIGTPLPMLVAVLSTLGAAVTGLCLAFHLYISPL